MSGHYFHRLRRIIRHCLFEAFLSMVVITVSASESLTSVGSSSRMQMIETFLQKRFEAVNQSDIDSLVSLVSKSIRKERTFHYMRKLREAMERETKRFEDLGNRYGKDWLIQAFMPAAYYDTSVLFTECALCRKNWQTSRCHVSRVELLVPLIHTDSRAKDNHERMFVEVNGHALNSSRGTVDISRAIIFDLSAVLLKSDSATQDGALNITIQKHPSRNVFPNRCMLYEYCNINNKILEKFREHKSQNEFVESRRYQVNNNSEDVDDNNTNSNNNNRTNNNRNNNTIENSRLSENDERHNPDILSHGHEKTSLRTMLSDQATKNSLDPKPSMSPEIEGKHNQIIKHQQKNKRQVATSAWESQCQRRRFYINFQRDMNRFDITIPSASVDIGRCSSNCGPANHFSDVNSRMTAHAVIVNSMGGQSPPVTCSPRRMSSITILKISETFSLVTENLANAVIDSCWCT